MTIKMVVADDRALVRAGQSARKRSNSDTDRQASEFESFKPCDARPVPRRTRR
jgi:hypothetical protein